MYKPDPKLIGPQNPILDPKTSSESNEEEARNLAWKILRDINEYVQKRDLTIRQAYSALVRAMIAIAIDLRINNTVMLEEVTRGARTYLKLYGRDATGKKINNDLPS